MRAYSTFESPETLGRKRFQSPRFFTDSFNRSSTGGCACGSLFARHNSYSCSAGKISSRMKSAIMSDISSDFGECVKSIRLSLLPELLETFFSKLIDLVTEVAELLSGHRAGSRAGEYPLRDDREFESRECVVEPQIIEGQIGGSGVAIGEMGPARKTGHRGDGGDER